MGDRFARQGKAPLPAFALAAKLAAEMVPVGNNSNREARFT